MMATPALSSAPSNVVPSVVTMVFPRCFFKLGNTLGSKWMLKDILRKSLPANLIARRKHGFGVPVGKWLNSGLKEQLLDFMNPTFLSNQGIFEPTLINRMQADHEKGRYDYRKELWSFLIFQRWYKKWMD